LLKTLEHRPREVTLLQTEEALLQVERSGQLCQLESHQKRNPVSQLRKQAQRSLASKKSPKKSLSKKGSRKSGTKGSAGILDNVKKALNLVALNTAPDRVMFPKGAAR
jgi:hypothetical protein